VNAISPEKVLKKVARVTPLSDLFSGFFFFIDPSGIIERT
jgi:hypothetical protein